MEKRSDLKIFNKLFADYQGRFVRFANKFVRDMPVAEDFTLEALMYYWENRHTLQPGASVPAYILTVIKHKCLNYLQHQQVRSESESRLQSQAEWLLQTRLASLKACEPEELFTAEIEAIVSKTLVEMPKRTRNIFIMSRYENKSYKEIAEQLGLTPKGVEFHISKALKTLRINLKDFIPVFIYLFF